MNLFWRIKFGQWTDETEVEAMEIWFCRMMQYIFKVVRERIKVLREVAEIRSQRSWQSLENIKEKEERENEGKVSRQAGQVAQEKEDNWSGY